MEEIKEKQKELKKQLNHISAARVLNFTIGVANIIWGNYAHRTQGYIMGTLFLIMFVALVKVHHKVAKKYDYFMAKEQALQFYKDRQSDEWKNKTIETIELDEAKLKDLDIIGQSSLYAYINTTHTKVGQEALLNYLSQKPKDRKSIALRQEAVKELLKDEDFAIHLHTISILFEKNKKDKQSYNIAEYIETSQLEQNYVPRWIHIVSLILPFLMGLSIMLIVLNYQPKRFMIIAEILFVVQLLISYFFVYKTGSVLPMIININEELGAYLDFLMALEKQSFESTYLKKIHENLFLKASALNGLKAFRHLSGQIKIRYNWLASVLLNGFFMWDVHCLMNLESWNRTYGDEVKEWIKSVGEIEALVSLSSIGRIKQTYCFPNIVADTTPVVSFKNMKHPLINEEKAIGNDFESHSTTTIITGSNMSGKTTFLRSIGVNLILAYAGAPVVADCFEASCMEIFTSMRIEDQVSEGISTFYAELLRIKEMVNYSERHLPMICLIDEIFKGTNSADRIFGATQIIQKLSKPWINVLVTTHDFELCDLEAQNSRKTMNYHFEEYYEDEKIKFDYKIKDGRCHTTNARYLLKMVGLTN